MVVQDLTTQEIREKARLDAKLVLEEHWPHLNLPVDPIAIARAMGLSVFTAQLGDDTWGMIVGSGNSADIFLDKDQSRARMRFSCAHELGHFVDHASALEPDKGYVDRRSDGNKGTADEIYANEFAASLLVPDQLLRARVAGKASNIELSSEFDVSLASVEYRRRLLGL